MNLLGYSKAFAYTLPGHIDEIKRILEELIEKGSANLGPAITMDNVLYYRDCTTEDPIFFQMVGKPHFIPVNDETRPDATTYYYKNILWIPNNDERKAYIKAFKEYLLNSEESLHKSCINNKIFCFQCINDEIHALS
jgi:hypothetical protein